MRGYFFGDDGDGNHDNHDAKVSRRENAKKKQKRTRIDFVPGRWARGTRKGPLKGPPRIVCFFFCFSALVFFFFCSWLCSLPLSYSLRCLASPISASLHCERCRMLDGTLRTPLHPLRGFPRFPDLIFLGCLEPLPPLLCNVIDPVVSSRHRHARRCHDPRPSLNAVFPIYGFGGSLLSLFSLCSTRSHC